MRPTAHCLKSILDDGEFPPRPEDETYKATCVTMLLCKPENPTLLAIVKADNPGYPWRNQVAFPGGHVDDADEDAAHAASRELFEELNIPEDHVTALGSIGHYHTINRRIVEAFVGVWDETGDVLFEPSEISRVLYIPVKDLMKTHLEKGFHGREPEIHELIYAYDDVEIWGVTARILHRFLETISPHMVAA